MNMSQGENDKHWYVNKYSPTQCVCSNQTALSPKRAHKLVFQNFHAKNFQLVWTAFENSISLLSTYLRQTSQKFQLPLLELINSLN